MSQLNFTNPLYDAIVTDIINNYTAPSLPEIYFFRISQEIYDVGVCVFVGCLGDGERTQKLT